MIQNMKHIFKQRKVHMVPLQEKGQSSKQLILHNIALAV